jgi:hypothetical protein
MNDKLIIYQILTRLFTNSNKYCVPNGTIEQNGCGKMNDITSHVLEVLAQRMCGIQALLNMPPRPTIRDSAYVMTIHISSKAAPVRHMP